MLLLWPPYGIWQAIIFLPCGFYLLLSFIFSLPNLSRRIGCLPYFHTRCGLSANLGCRSETCCTRLAENTGRKNDAQNRHLRTIAQLCRATRAISSQLRHVSTIGKKVAKQQYLPHLYLQYGEVVPLAAEIKVSLGHPS